MEIMREVVKRCIDYETGDDYANLRVEMEVIPPIFTTSPWIFLDGIVNYLCVREALGDLFYNLPSEKNLNFKVDLPIKRRDDVPCCSVGIYDENVKLVKDTMYKRFTDKEAMSVLSEKAKSKKVQIDRGYFKDTIINLPAVLSDTITFHTVADKSELKRLCKHITSIGKKSSINAGNIRNINITEEMFDQSFFNNKGEFNRPIPISFPFVDMVYQGVIIQKQAYKPPYWNDKNVKMCYCPRNQLIPKKDE